MLLGGMRVDKEQLLRELIDTGVIAVIRTKSGAELVKICGALVLEASRSGITMTSPGAIDAIREASEILRGKPLSGQVLSLIPRPLVQ